MKTRKIYMEEYLIMVMLVTIADFLDDLYQDALTYIPIYARRLWDWMLYQVLPCCRRYLPLIRDALMWALLTLTGILATLALLLASGAVRVWGEVKSGWNLRTELVNEWKEEA